MPNIILPSIDGGEFDISLVKGKRIILTFFRFESCPFCNIRINKITKRWSEFNEDTVMVGIFDANVDKLTKSMKKHNPPFVILADEEYTSFKEYEIQKSIFRVLFAPLRAPMTTLHAILKGYIPKTLSISKMSTIPVDILIDENGNVVRSHYCKDTVDHIPINDLIKFSNGG